MNLLLDKIKNLSHTRQAEKLNSPRYHLIMLSHNCINAYMMKGENFSFNRFVKYRIQAAQH